LFFRKYKILFDLQEKKNIYMQRKKYVQSKKKAKNCIVKGDIPKLCIRITHKYKKKEIVKKGKRNMILLNEFADVIH